MKPFVLWVAAALAISMSAPPLAAADAPPASDQAATPAPVTSPDWTRGAPESCGGKRPRYYPPGAQSMHREGRAVLRCHVTAQGAVDSCVVVSEDPPGLGFGEAALRMSCLFKFKPKTVAGQPVDSEATIPIRFGLKD